MRQIIRTISDRTFTVLSGASIVLLAALLLIILGPMMFKGVKAVAFKGTVEFRKMQLDLFQRGKTSTVKSEIDEVQEHRKFIYERINKFKKGLDTDTLQDKAKQIYRQFGKELRYKEIDGEQYRQLRKISRDIRDNLIAAFESNSKTEIETLIQNVLEYRDDVRFADTSVVDFFELADDFIETVEKINLQKRQYYAESLKQVEHILSGSEQMPGLLGPRPDEPVPALTMLRYGVTRWDQAKILLDKLLWAEQWVQEEPGQPLVKIRTSRADQFAGTELEPLFEFIESNLKKLLNPKFTFYWQYFIDDSTPGHYFGGVGPEVLGTLLLTVIAMIFVFPLGVISAAYLVECAGDNWIVRIIRMSINTLAGVPSIVFGLFGLAFFVLFLLPLFGVSSKPSILAASLTLAVLTLPVMIRASEEAIRAVPQTYKEASLGLGASRFRTFVKVTLPAALPGILTGTILSLSRVAGETAPILFTGAVALGPLPKSLLDPTRTLSYGSYDIAVGDRLAMMVPHQQYGMVITLVVLILFLNAVAIILRSRVFRKLRGM